MCEITSGGTALEVAIRWRFFIFFFLIKEYDRKHFKNQILYDKFFGIFFTTALSLFNYAMAFSFFIRSRFLLCDGVSFFPTRSCFIIMR